MTQEPGPKENILVVTGSSLPEPSPRWAIWAFVYWCAQLVGVGALGQFLVFIYGLDDDVKQFLVTHRDATTIALIAYFAVFIILRVVLKDKFLTRTLLSILDKEDR